MIISNVVLKEWCHNQAYFSQIEIYIFICTQLVLLLKDNKVQLQSVQLSKAGALDQMYFIFSIKKKPTVLNTTFENQTPLTIYNFSCKILWSMQISFPSPVFIFIYTLDYTQQGDSNKTKKITIQLGIHIQYRANTANQGA